MRPAARRQPLAYRRLETDREYCERLIASRRLDALSAQMATYYSRASLDAIGDVMQPPMQRRIVEIFE